MWVCRERLDEVEAVLKRLQRKLDGLQMPPLRFVEASNDMVCSLPPLLFLLSAASALLAPPISLRKASKNRVHTISTRLAAPHVYKPVAKRCRRTSRRRGERVSARLGERKIGDGFSLHVWLCLSLHVWLWCRSA